MVAEADVVVECEPENCECGAMDLLSERAMVERRQVFDLPEPRLEVVEYRRVKRKCKCGKTVSGKFPASVLASVQYGTRVQAMVSLLSVHGCLPHRKIGQLFGDLYGYQLNEATTQDMVTRTAAQVPMAEIRAGILGSKVVNFDETGIKEGGQLKWLHNASTAELTYQFVHRNRGNKAMKSKDSIIAEYRGIGVHDCWASYFGFSEMKHAVCNAHILRELTGIIENGESKWGLQMKQLLLEMYEKSEFGKDIIQEIVEYEKRYLEIIRVGEAEEPPPKRTNPKGKMKRTKGRNLLERLSKYKDLVLMFAKVGEVPFTNNQAERDIRPVKVKQKMSGGFRSEVGTQSYTRIASFISTMRKMKRQVFQELRSVLENQPFVLFQT